MFKHASHDQAYIYILGTHPKGCEFWYLVDMLYTWTDEYVGLPLLFAEACFSTAAVRNMCGYGINNKTNQALTTMPSRTARRWRRAGARGTGRRLRPSSSRWRTPTPSLSCSRTTTALLLRTRPSRRWPRPRCTATRSSSRTAGANGACVRAFVRMCTAVHDRSIISMYHTRLGLIFVLHELFSAARCTL